MLIAQAQLPTFVVVAELLNLSAAARKLGITQTGATQRIKTLEQALGATLFTRSRSGMRLTEEGQLLLRYCTAVSNLEGQFLSGITGAGRTREVELCVVGPMSLLAGRVVPRCTEIARSLYDLWHFREAVFSLVACRHDQTRAAGRLAELDLHFRRRARS